MKPLHASTLAVALAAGDVQTVRSAITGGAVDTGYPAVGALVADQGFQCSATLVGARSVLTAAHCIAPGLSGYRFVVDGESYVATRAVAHPAYDPSTNVADIAVLELEVSPGLPPLAISPASPAVGAKITLVGLGCASARPCELGTTQSATNTVDEVSAHEIVFLTGASGGGHCDGDSGGPLLADGRVVGVHSWGPVSCRGSNHDARVDTELAWIREATGGDVVIAPLAPSPASDEQRGGCSP